MHLTNFVVDSEMGRWSHSEWRPPQLASVVEYMWHFEGRMALTRERLFPGAYLELIIHLGPRFREVDAAGRTGSRFALACVTGMQTGPAVIEAPPGESCVLGVRLRPLGAYALLGRPVAESTGLTVDLSDIAGRAATELAERCRELHLVEDRFRCVAAWIVSRLVRSESGVPAVAFVAERLERSHGAEAIGTLQRQTGRGKARFAQLFREQVGLTPKHYARVLRFRRTLALLQDGSRLSEAAFSAGYYDQSHMNADFREFAGMTPAEIVAAARYPNSPSLAESV